MSTRKTSHKSESFHHLVRSKRKNDKNVPEKHSTTTFHCCIRMRAECLKYEWECHYEFIVCTVRATMLRQKEAVVSPTTNVCRNLANGKDDHSNPAREKNRLVVCDMWGNVASLLWMSSLSCKSGLAHKRPCPQGELYCVCEESDVERGSQWNVMASCLKLLFEMWHNTHTGTKATGSGAR